MQQRDEALERFAAAVGAVAAGDGVFEAPVRGAVCVRHSSVSALQNRHWRASLAIVARGSKQLVVGRSSHRFDPWHYTLTPFPLPLTGRIVSAPFLCLLIDFDALALTRLVADMDGRQEAPEGLRHAFFVGEVSGRMRDAALRLAELFESREASHVLGPGCVRELLFHVLQGPNGPAIRQFMRAGSEAHRIYRAVHRIETELSDELDIALLAADAGMSRTVFFEQFKRVTALSPVQFQKRLRLLEAQRLLVEERASAEHAASRVGYRSPHQFSREYTRMFGEPPLRNATRLRRSPGLLVSSAE
ncbi:MAG TPA: AraC family transcriptional regulator [Polyangiaceae bacterium]|nr:AraC family transcriptional regulator [Polyangiaceae bacterium]